MFVLFPVLCLETFKDSILIVFCCSHEHIEAIGDQALWAFYHLLSTYASLVAISI